LRGKHGEEEIESIHPKHRPILEGDLGRHRLPGTGDADRPGPGRLQLGEADLLRRAMGKKIKAEMDASSASASSKGAGRARRRSSRKADEIFDLLAKFADYGFNKSHAAAYALVSYQTAYLKAHYPVEFFAASMTLDMGNTDKLNEFRQDAMRLGIEVARGRSR
jgi:DNA polymerase-3 subunit alpha